MEITSLHFFSFVFSSVSPGLGLGKRVSFLFPLVSLLPHLEKVSRLPFCLVGFWFRSQTPQRQPPLPPFAPSFLSLCRWIGDSALVFSRSNANDPRSIPPLFIRGDPLPPTQELYWIVGRSSMFQDFFLFRPVEEILQLGELTNFPPICLPLPTMYLRARLRFFSQFWICRFVFFLPH